jgi:hypothetical protein
MERERRAIQNLLLVFFVAIGAVSVVVLQAQPASGVPSTWSIAASPDKGSGDQLWGVSCSNSKSCEAVGDYLNRSGDFHTLAEFWDGTAWNIVRSPNPSPTGRNELFAVSCRTSLSCVAVGAYANDTLIESWDGTEWSVASSPDPSATTNALNGVSCTSSTACTAVGDYGTGSDVTKTLVESLSHGTWSVVASPDIGTADDLSSLSCTSTTSCVAVGDYATSTSAASETLIESWDGAKWSIDSSPDPGEKGDWLNSVSCTSSDKCVAVGMENSNDGWKALIESWDGTSWSVTRSPRSGQLRGISCRSARSCVAVGNYATSAGAASETLIESWDGTAWSVDSSPNPVTNGDWLEGVSCPSSNSCQAAGFYSAGPGFHGLRNLIEAGS